MPVPRFRRLRPLESATMAFRLLLCSCLLLVVACQPVDEPDLDAHVIEGGEGANDPVGSPQESLPSSLGELLAQHETTAAQWQSGAVVAEIVVSLDEDGSWSRASVTYLAPDADRFLLLEVGPDGTSQERPTLEGLELPTVPADALAELPDPEALLDPGALRDAAAETLDACGVGSDAVTVIYATGAPTAWDGQTWTEPPAWRATMSGDGAAVVDPTTGEPAAAAPCLAD